MKPLSEIKVQDAIYAAGFFDGEGCIGVYKKARNPGSINQRYALIVCVSNTHEGVLHHLAKTIGGVVNKPYVNAVKRPNRQPIARWSLQARRAGQFLKAVLPYLIVKKDQAALAVEFADITTAQLRGKRGQRQMRPFSPEDIAYRESVYLRLKAMKNRGNRQAESNRTPQLSL